LASEPWQLLPRQGEVLAGKYRVARMLGRGGMGTVFLAENEATGKRVAIKWLDASTHDELARARFQREARAAGQVHHPHVVDIYDVSEHAGCPFLVMEYLEGRSLQKVLDERGRLPVNEALAWLIPAMEGVAAAHALGIVHRDLKPDNIFLCERPGAAVHAKVLDFGVAKTLTAASCEGDSLTRPGTLLGSPGYMPIEQIDALEIDARADVYAFGVILYRAFGGALPYEHRSLSQLIAQISAGTPKPLREHEPAIASGLAAVVARAMARDARARFADLGQLQAALAPYRERASGAHPRVDARARRRLSPLWVVSALAVLFACGWFVRARSPRGAAQVREEASARSEVPASAQRATEAAPRGGSGFAADPPPVATATADVAPATDVEAPRAAAPQALPVSGKKARRAAPAKKLRAVYEPPLL